MNLGTRSNITWARCGIASLVGATHCPCSEPSRYSLVKGRIERYLSMGRVCSQTIDYSVN